VAVSAWAWVSSELGLFSNPAVDFLLFCGEFRGGMGRGWQAARMDVPTARAVFVRDRAARPADLYFAPAGDIRCVLYSDTGLEAAGVKHAPAQGFYVFRYSLSPLPADVGASIAYIETPFKAGGRLCGCDCRSLSRGAG
jgi:hypothetical protein